MKTQKEKGILKHIKIFFLIGFIGAVAPSTAQETVIDEIVGVVGDKVILKSDVETEIIRMKNETQTAVKGGLETVILENMLISKLLLAQAEIDSIEVSEAEVENQLDARIDQYVRYSGSIEKLEEYFNKTVAEMKNELRDPTRDQLIAQKMQREIVKDIKVTPAEVRAKFREIPADSLPVMPTKMMVEQIVRYPEISQKEEDRIREKLRTIRDEVYQGASFATKAVFFSEDPGSAQRGGELGYMAKSSLVEEFAKAAFNLRPGKISKIVQTEFGFHIIQLIDRRGDKVNVRHILMKPKTEPELKLKAQNQMDSIRNLVLEEKLSFDLAAMHYSDDKNSRLNGGLVVNPQTGGAYFEKAELPASISRNIQNLKVQELSEVFFDESGGRESYKFVRIKSEIPEHKANLNEDWSIFENLTLESKKQEVLEAWIKEKLENTYTDLSQEYRDFPYQYSWIK